MGNHNKAEEEKMAENERALKKMQKRLRDEEWKMLRGEGDEDEPKKSGGGGGKKKQGKKAQGQSDAAATNVFGSMAGGEDESSDEVSDAGSSDPQISVGGSD